MPAAPACVTCAAQNQPNAILWCAYDSSTWILSTFALSSPALPAAIQLLLSRALAQILAHIQQTSDGPITDGFYGYLQAPSGGGTDISTIAPASAAAAGGSGGTVAESIHGENAYAVPPASGSTSSYPQPTVPQGLTLSALNANNHQLTWGVLGAAIQALLNLMANQEWWGAAMATVWDGENEVGTLLVTVGVPGGWWGGAGSSGN